MAKLIECESCKGLKRAESERCPHCETVPSQAPSRLKRSLTVAGIGALAACGPGGGLGNPTPAYGIICTPNPDSGVCGQYKPPLHDAGGDGGKITDAGTDGPYYTGADAYGIVCSYDPDSGTCVPPGRDAGPLDAGNDED